MDAFDKKMQEVNARVDSTTLEDTDDDGNEDFELRNSVLVFSHKQEEEKVTLKDFEVMGVIGRGTFGKVFLGTYFNIIISN